MNTYCVQIVVENETVFDEFLVYAYKVCDEVLLSDEAAGADPVAKGKGAGGRNEVVPVDGPPDRNELLLMGLDLKAYAGKSGGAAGGLGKKGRSPGDLIRGPYLVVTDWWLEHLRLKDREATGAGGASEAPTSDLTMLKWVYGKIACQLVSSGLRLLSSPSLIH